MNLMIAGGGTGGHLFPGIALAQEVRRREKDSNILFVGTERGIEVKAVPKAGFELSLLPVSGLRRVGVVGKLVGLMRLPLALFQAARLIRRFKPDVAVSVGGYAAGPAVLAARLLGVPCVVMEQNSVAGVTNRILGKVAKLVVAAMPTSDFPASKVRVLGNPVRADLLPVRELPYEPASPLRLFIFGGSQGARAINELMMSAAPLLSQMPNPLNIHHQTGPADLQRVQAAYDAAGFNDVRVVPFIDDMASAYANADLVLARAGATSIAEITVCGRPSILVPFPYAVDDHQTANARTLEEAGAARLEPQSGLSAEKIVQILNELSAEPSRLAAMAKISRDLGKPESAKDIADAIEKEVLHVQR
ncbi:undecaprenyldiphospho-muramoylpentapeptide beta-N-acetylglucosaminyltransferase [Myxococcota bacterium]|nr:undecaprenyldiphospho-muramoylpentapeptide beta-N-acetylglucosaminyltransferase [Myxococcota bacterium]